MSLSLFAVLLAAFASAAPPPGALRAGEPYWFKTYSTAPYKESWTGELVVKDLARDLPALVEKIQAGGGALTQPLGNFVSSRSDASQQLSFSVPSKGAKPLLAAMRKLGTMADPTVRALGVPIPLAEVQAKIKVMMKEKTDHAAALAQVPAAAAAEEEILEHLLLVEDVAKRTETVVLFNLLVRQK
jgi:hypothetical protein